MHALLALTACALLGAAEPAPLLNLTELDQDGDSTPLSSSAALVDIGSDIRVEVQVEALRKVAVPAIPTPETQRLLADYQALTQATERLTTILEPLAKAFQTYSSLSSPTDADREAFQKAITGSASARRQLLLYATDKNAPPSRSRQRLRTAINAALDQEGTAAEIYTSIAEAARQELEVLRRELDSTLKQEGMYIQLGAFLVTPDAATPIHLPGFDDYQEGPRYDYERWRIALTDDQKQQLKTISDAAKTVNDKGFGELARTEGPKVFTQRFESTAAALDKLIEELSVLEENTTAEVAAIQARVKQVRTEASTYRDFLLGLVSKYRSPAATTSFSDFLAGTNADLEEAVRRAKALEPSVTALRTAVDGLAGRLPELTRPVATALETAVNALKADAVLNAKQLTQAIASLFAVHQVSTAALVFGEQVKKLTLDELPPRTQFSLPNAGRRAPGDSVVIKIGMGRGERPPQELEVRRLVVYRLLAHFETVVALIFADRPEVEGVDSTGRFQLAPSYSVLLKGGARGNNPFWNNILTPGIGLNLSALDFNRDGTPELGLGVTLALFRDILQVGYGYNVFQDAGYFFFGVGLPMPSFGGTPGSAPETSTAR